MLIGIDMLAVQSPGSRGRGIGRYGQSLVEAMMARAPGHEFVLYAHEGFPDDAIPRAPNARRSTVRIEAGRGEAKLRDAVGRIVSENGDGLDVFMTLGPFELCPGYDPPHRPLGGPVAAAVVYDFIPFLFQEHYLADPPNAAWAYRRLNTLRSYDLLLSISESTRADALRLLESGPDRVVTILGASDPGRFRPDRSLPMPWQARATLGRLGIGGPFVFSLAGRDERKNMLGLLDAFAMIRGEVRRSHQLVITCELRPEDAERVRNHADSLGIGGRLVLTGEVPDEELVVLYQRCAAFAFPSKYEGLGLPILEAMHCGAAVVAGNNSSQVEVVGDAGLLCNVLDAGDVAAGLERVLTDSKLADDLGARGRERAASFTWAKTADAAIGAIEAAAGQRPGRRLRADRGHAAGGRPKVAIFSPWPPKGSGIADYASHLIPDLARHCDLHLYHDGGYVPDLALRSADFPTYDYRLFDRMERIHGYDALLHQMGNSYYHGFIYAMLRRHGGIVTLHDMSLAAFQFWIAHLGGVPSDNLWAEIDYCYPDRVKEIMAEFWGWTRERGGIQEACVRRGLHLNRRVLDSAQAVVVHSPWCVDEIRRTHPESLEKLSVIPHGAAVRPPSAGLRAATRDRFGLPREALVFGSFGILAQGKMNVEAIDAFAAIAGDFPDALLLFVGHDWESGEASRAAEATGLGDRIRFTGRVDDEAFLDLIAATDVGIALRRPPTYGETSGATLDLMRSGVPAVVNDVATFSGYPDSVVRKVRWGREGLDGLVAALRAVAVDPAERAVLGRSAMEFVAREHAWPRAASLYAEVIDKAASARRRSRRPGARPTTHTQRGAR